MPHAKTLENACCRSRMCSHSGLVSDRMPAVEAARCGRRSSSAMRISTSCCGMRDRQRAQAHGVEQLEDRRVGADAERQRQNRDEREAGLSRSRRAP